MALYIKNILLYVSLCGMFCNVSLASPLTEALKSSIEVKLTSALENKGKTEKDIATILYGTEAAPLWNSDAWTRDLDFTGVAWWNSADGSHRRGTLITPRHLLIATHYTLSVGNTVTFLNKDNKIIHRKITAKKTLSLPADLADRDLKTIDIDILELASDVPAEIRHYPLFDVADLGARIDDTFPIISLNQDNKPSILATTYAGDYATTSLRNTYKGKLLSDGNYEDFTLGEPYLEFRQAPLRKGDSSNPLFALIGDELVLFSHHSRVGSSTNFSWFTRNIDQTLADMGSPYRVTVKDVSKFQTTTDVHQSPSFNAAPEVPDETFLIKKNTSQTPTLMAYTGSGSQENMCEARAKYASCYTRFYSYGRASKMLSCLGMLPTQNGNRNDFVKRSDTLTMALKILGKDLIEPRADITIYRDMKNDRQSIALTQTGIQYGLLSGTNRFFRPNRNTTRAEAYHMLAKSVCLPIIDTYPQWEKNLYTAAYSIHLTTQTWTGFESARYITRGELMIIGKRALEYTYKYGGCETPAEKSSDICSRSPSGTVSLFYK